MNKTKLAVMLLVGILILPHAYSGEVAQVHHMVTSIYFLTWHVIWADCTVSVSGGWYKITRREIRIWGNRVFFCSIDVGLSFLA